VPSAASAADEGDARRGKKGKKGKLAVQQQTGADDASTLLKELTPA
jgi:hypothetical protein